MATHAQGKRRGFTVTLDPDQRSVVEGRMAVHNMDRNEYFWALVEADTALPLKIAIHEVTNDRVLRPVAQSDAAPSKTDSTYGVTVNKHVEPQKKGGKRESA